MTQVTVNGNTYDINGVLVPNGERVDLGEAFGVMLNTITELNAGSGDITTLQDDVDTLQTDVGTLQTDVGTLQTDVGTLQTDVGTLQTDLNTAEGDIDTLEAGKGQVLSYTVATVPDATLAANLGRLIWVTDGNAGVACPAISDGTNWKVIALGATISAS